MACSAGREQEQVVSSRCPSRTVDPAMRQLSDGLAVGVVVAEAGDGSALYANEAWCDMTGQDEAAWRGQGWLDALAPGTRAGCRDSLLTAAATGAPFREDWTAFGADGRPLVLQVLARHQRAASRPDRLSMAIIDVTDERAALQRLSHQATHDHLTGLYNRTQGLEFVSHALDQQRRHPDRLDAVLFIDVDGLKRINDERGHDGGDEVLRAAAARILSCVRPSDIVARYGGDEFVVLCEDVPDLAEVEAIARRIAGDPHEPSISEQVGLSVGVAVANDPDTDPTVLVARADRAMYVVKHESHARRAAGRGGPADGPAPT